MTDQVVPSAYGVTSKGLAKPLTPLQKKVEQLDAFETATGATPAAVQDFSAVGKAINRQRLETLANAPAPITPTQTAKAAVGGLSRDLLIAAEAHAIRQAASQDVDPNWDVGTKRKEFRSKYPSKYWSVLENTKNEEQYNAQVQILDDKDQRDTILAANPGTAIAASILDPVSILGAGMTAKAGQTLAHTFKLSKYQAIGISATAETSLIAGMVGGAQILETGELTDAGSVAQAAAWTFGLHFGAQAALTKKGWYEAPPSSVAGRVEPHFGPLNEIWMSEAGIAGEAALPGGMRQTYADALKMTENANNSLADSAMRASEQAIPVRPQVPPARDVHAEKAARELDAQRASPEEEALSLARQKNTFDGRGSSMEGKSQPEDTPLDKLFSNFADVKAQYPDNWRDNTGRGRTVQQAREEEMARLRTEMMARADRDSPWSQTVSVSPDMELSVTLTGDVRLRGYSEGEHVASLRIVRGKVDSIASTVSGTDVPKKLLQFAYDNDLANVRQVPDRSPGFVKLQREVLANKGSPYAPQAPQMRVPTESEDLTRIVREANENVANARLEAPRAFERMEGWLGNFAAATSSFYKVMQSKSAVMQDLAMRLGESSTGWFRGVTSGAAVDRESYNRIIRDSYSQVRPEAVAYAKRTGQGGNLGLNQSVEQEFNYLLRNEMEARWLLNGRSAEEQAAADALRWQNVAPEVRRAADALDSGSQKAAKLLADVDPAYADLATRRGYVSRVLDGDKLASLSAKELDNAYKLLGRQVFKAVQASQRQAMRLAQDPTKRPGKLITTEGAESVARAMINRAMSQASGVGGSTIGLFDKAARDEIENILKSRGMDSSDVKYTMNLLDKRLDENSGSSRLRERMDMDLFDTDGESGMRLMDLYRNDLENLYTRYADEMSGRIAMSQAGIKTDNDLEKFLQAAFHEGKETGDVLEAQAKEVRFMYNQMLGRVSDGQNRSAAVSMLTQTASFQNLQQVGFAQFGETGPAAALLGLGTVLRSVPALIKIVGGARDGAFSGREAAMLREVNKANGTMGEMWRTHRLSTQVNEYLATSSQKAQIVDRALKAGQEVSGWISGMHHIMEWQTKFTAANATAHFAEAAFRGEKLNKRLLDAGFTEKNWGRIQEQIKKHATAEDGSIPKTAEDVFHLNAEKWEPSVMRDFMRTIERTSAQLVQRDFAGEGASWMQSDLGRIMLSMRGYPVKALNKQLIRNLSIGDVQSAMMVGYGLAFSTLAYTAKTYVSSIGRPDADEYLERRLSGDWFAAGVIGYASMSTIMPDLLRPLQSWYVGEDERHRYLEAGSVFNAVFPGLSPVERLGSAAWRAGDWAVGQAQGDDRTVWNDASARRDLQSLTGNSVIAALLFNQVLGATTD